MLSLIQDFLPSLKNHFLVQILHPEQDHRAYTFSAQERLNINICKDRLYWHTIFRVNYTSYDLRRAQDTINLKTHSDIMMVNTDWSDLQDSTSSNSTHPYRYAWVIGIFHVNVTHRADGHSRWSDQQRLEVLWVRWFELDTERHCGGWSTSRLPALTFVDDNRSGVSAFGFVDPKDVIRGVHVIPSFFSDDMLSDTTLLPSLARIHNENFKSVEDRRSLDYEIYYVNV